MTTYNSPKIANSEYDLLPTIRQQQLHAYERRVKTKTVQPFFSLVSKYAALQSGRD